MRRPTRRRALVAVLALATPLILSSSSVGTGPAAAAGGSDQADVCEAGAASDRRVEVELRRLSERPELRGDPNIVVLNGRGYNYGPAPEGRIDRIRLEALEAEAELGHGR